MNITYAHINAYIKGTTSKAINDLIESEIDQDPKLLELVNRKKEELILMDSIIPQIEVTDREITREERVFASSSAFP